LGRGGFKESVLGPNMVGRIGQKLVAKKGSELAKNLRDVKFKQSERGGEQGKTSPQSNS